MCVWFTDTAVSVLLSGYRVCFCVEGVEGFKEVSFPASQIDDLKLYFSATTRWHVLLLKPAALELRLSLHDQNQKLS